MRLSSRDIEDLMRAVRCAPTGVYKGGYTYAPESKGVVAFLARNGVQCKLDDKSGLITVARRTGTE